MRFHTKQHKFYCGIDLHTKKMYVCILDETGEIRLHQNIKKDRKSITVRTKKRKIFVMG